MNYPDIALNYFNNEWQTMFSPLPPDAPKIELCRRIGVAVISPFAYLAIFFCQALCYIGNSLFGRAKKKPGIAGTGENVVAFKERLHQLASEFTQEFFLKLNAQTILNVKDVKLFTTLTHNKKSANNDYVFYSLNVPAITSQGNSNNNPRVSFQDLMKQSLIQSMEKVNEKECQETKFLIGLWIKTTDNEMRHIYGYGDLSLNTGMGIKRTKNLTSGASGHELQGWSQYLKYCFKEWGREWTPQFDDQGNFLK